MARRQRKGPTPERAERMGQVLQSRIDGVKFADIAKEHGISTTQAWHDYNDAITGLFEPQAEQYVLLEMERNEADTHTLNDQIKLAVKEVLNAHEAGSMAAAPTWMDTIVKLVNTKAKLAAQRHRLLGLDKGVTVDATVEVTSAITEMFSSLLDADPEDFEPGADVEE